MNPEECRHVRRGRTVVCHHHERVDGQGYPRISEPEIPLLSRIIAVADAYNAMTSDRPYRDAMPSRVARLRLAQAVETQFDTAVVAAFEALLAGADENYRLARGAQFVLEGSAGTGGRASPASSSVCFRSEPFVTRYGFSSGADAELLQHMSHVNLRCGL